MFKCKNKVFENLFTLKPRSKYRLKRGCTFLEPYCKSKFSQLCVNYRRPNLWNIIALSQNTDLEQPRTLEVFKEKLKAYPFTLDNVTLYFNFEIVLYKKIKMSHKELVI